MNDLQIGYKEYIILDLMIKQSENNIYNKGVSYLANWLGISRTTFYKEKYLEVLTKKRHITKDENSKKGYLLNYDLKERLEQENGKFTTIYKSFKSLGVQSINQYIFYYSVFTHSRKQEYASASKKYYAEIIGIKPNTIFTYIKDDFVIQKPNTSFMKLTPIKEKWFLERQSVQFLESKK